MDLKSIVRDLINDVWQGDGDMIDRVVSPRWVNHDPQLPDTGRGPAAYRASIEFYKTAFPDSRLTVEKQVAEGDTVCTLWRAHGTNTGRFMDMNPTNRKVEMQGMTLDRFEGGQIVESWDSYDALGMMQQLGFVPRSPGAPQPNARQQPHAK